MSKLFFQDFLQTRPPSKKKHRTMEDFDGISDRKQTTNQSFTIQKQLQHQNLQLVDQNAALEMQLHHQQYELETIKVKMTAMQQLNATQTNMFHHKQENTAVINELEVKLQDARTQIHKLNNELQNEKTLYTEQLLKKEHEYTQQLSKLEQQYISKQQQMQGQFDECLREVNRRNLCQMNKLMSDNQQLNQYLTQLEGKKSQANELQNQEIHKLQNDLVQSKQELKILKEQQTTIVEQSKTLEKCIRTIKIEKRVLSESLRNSNEQFKAMESDNQQKCSQIQRINEQLVAKDAQISQLEHIAFGLKQSAEQGKDNVNQTLHKYQQLMEECDILEQQINKLEQDNTFISKEYDLIDGENKQLRSINKDLVMDVENLQLDNHNLSQEIQKLGQKVIELQQYAAGFQKELKQYMVKQNKINQQRSYQNSSSNSKQRNSYNSINNESLAIGNQSPLQTITNSNNTQEQLKRIVKQQSIVKNTRVINNSVENSKRYQQGTDTTTSKVHTERLVDENQLSERSMSQQPMSQSKQQKENSLQMLQDKYYALRNRIYDQQQ